MSAITVSQPRPANQQRQEKIAVNIWVTTATSKTNISPAAPCQRWWYINRNQPVTSEVTAQCRDQRNKGRWLGRAEINKAEDAGTAVPVIAIYRQRPAKQ